MHASALWRCRRSGHPRSPWAMVLADGAALSCFTESVPLAMPTARVRLSGDIPSAVIGAGYLKLCVTCGRAAAP